MDNLKKVDVEIWNAAHSKKAGNAQQHSTTATDKAGSVTIKDDFKTNTVYSSFTKDTKVAYKVIVTRNDGTVSTKWVDYTVPVKAIKDVIIPPTISGNTFKFVVNSTGNSKIAGAEATFYAPSDTKQTGTKYGSKKASVPKAVNSATISGSFLNFTSIKTAGTYKAKVDVLLANKKTVSNVVDAKVSQTVVDAIKKDVAVKKAVADKAAKIAKLDKERKEAVNLGVIAGSTNTAVFKFSDPYKLAKSAKVAIYDANGKFLWNASTSSVTFAKPGNLATVNEKLDSSKYKKNTTYRVKVTILRTDGSQSTLSKPFKTGTLLYKK